MASPTPSKDMPTEGEDVIAEGDDSIVEGGEQTEEIVESDPVPEGPLPGPPEPEPTFEEEATKFRSYLVDTSLTETLAQSFAQLYDFMLENSDIIPDPVHFIHNHLGKTLQKRAKERKGTDVGNDDNTLDGDDLPSELSKVPEESKKQRRERIAPSVFTTSLCATKMWALLRNRIRSDDGEIVPDLLIHELARIDVKWHVRPEDVQTMCIFAQRDGREFDGNDLGALLSFAANNHTRVPTHRPARLELDEDATTDTPQ